MNVTSFLAEMRDLLNDPVPKKWTDAELLRTGDRMIRGITRKMTEIDGSHLELWHNIAKDEFTEIYDTVFEAQMPDWATRVLHLLDRQPDGGASFNSSPYLVLNGGNIVSEQILQTIPMGNAGIHDRFGAIFTEHKTLRIYGPANPRDVTVRVAKRPARMFKATLTTDAIDDKTIIVPTTLTLGTLENETGAYRNAIIEWTLGLGHSPGVFMEGDIRKVVQSTSKHNNSGTRAVKLDLDRATTDEANTGDQIETVIEIPDEHTRLLLLRTAYASFQKYSDRTSQRSLEIELNEESDAFDVHIQPRQTQEPAYVSRRSFRGRRHQNRNDLIGGWWY